MFVVRRYNSFFGGMLVLFVVLTLVLAVGGIAKAVETNNRKTGQIKQVVIDAGHGGGDPGAIGVNGANEKDINLKISIYLRDILIANGYEVIMTRETDISIHDEKHTKTSKIKTSDLKNRLKLIESHPDAIAVLIHQNEFTSKKSCGAQMFYGRKNEESIALAQSIQDAFVKNIQPDNNREIKKSTKDVYIINNAKNPIVLVECGFISNPNEADLLVDEEYQKKVAFTIFCGIANAE